MLDTALARLGASRWPFSFTLDDQPAALPDQVAGLFARRATTSPQLVVDPTALSVACHFFVLCEIEFDLDPRALTGAPAFGRLRAFIRAVGRILQKPVILAPENLPARPWLRFDPAKAALDLLLLAHLSRGRRSGAERVAPLSHFPFP